MKLCQEKYIQRQIRDAHESGKQTMWEVSQENLYFPGHVPLLKPQERILDNYFPNFKCRDGLTIQEIYFLISDFLSTIRQREYIDWTFVGNECKFVLTFYSLNCRVSVFWVDLNIYHSKDTQTFIVEFQRRERSDLSNELFHELKAVLSIENTSIERNIFREINFENDSISIVENPTIENYLLQIEKDLTENSLSLKQIRYTIDNLLNIVRDANSHTYFAKLIPLLLQEKIFNDRILLVISYIALHSNEACITKMLDNEILPRLIQNLTIESSPMQKRESLRIISACASLHGYRIFANLSLNELVILLRQFDESTGDICDGIRKLLV
jgi:hypothetical protein